MLKRKFNTGVKSRLQLSYMSEDLSGPMLKKIQKGASGVELPDSLMKSFFHPLF